MWAASLHQHQQRKINHTPYIAHLLSVSALVLEHGGDEHQAIAALLHDAVEDQGVSLSEIHRRFGAVVAEYVAVLSEPTTYPQLSWRVRKERYLQQLRMAPPEVVLISLADKLHNARSVEAGLQCYGEDLWDMFFGARRQELSGFISLCWMSFKIRGWRTIG